MSVISAQMASRFASIRSSEDGDEKAVTIRPSSTALFGVDSFDRFPTPTASQFGTSSPYSFTIAKNQNVFTGFFKRLALTEVVFPYYIPNINPRTNSMKVIYNGGAEATLTIANGFYTPSALAAALETQLITLTNANTTVVYSSTGQFIIDVDAGNDVILFPIDTNAFGLFDLIGGTADWINPGGQILTGKVTRCRYTEYIDIVCSQLTYNQELKDSSTTNGPIRDILARIYLETENDQPLPVLIGVSGTDVFDAIPGCYPFTIYRQFKTPKQIKWEDSQPIGNLTFEVYDDRGVLLSGNAGSDYIYPDWRMTLLISEN
jgi:hypothetical protein